MKRGDVYWVDFEPTRGGEIRKERPAVIVSNGVSNRVLNRVQVLTLTTSTTRIYPSEALVHVNHVAHKALADQIRTITKEPLTNFVGTISTHDLLAVERAIRLQLGLH